MLDRLGSDKAGPWVILAAVLVLGTILISLWIAISDTYQSAYRDYAASQHEAARKQDFEERCGRVAAVEELRRCYADHIARNWNTQREQEDLYAQKQMADWAFWMMLLTAAIGIPGLALTAFGVMLVLENLREARKVFGEAVKQTAAANAAVGQAQRQADAGIQMEAAKFVLEEAILAKSYGAKQMTGVPEHDSEIQINFRNIGKTPAFILSSCVHWTVTNARPRFRFPLRYITRYMANTIVERDKGFSIDSELQPISFNEAENRAIATDHTTFWVYGYLRYLDWFGNERDEYFLLRWKPCRWGNEPPNTVVGFIIESTEGLIRERAKAE